MKAFKREIMELLQISWLIYHQLYSLPHCNHFFNFPPLQIFVLMDCSLAESFFGLYLYTFTPFMIFYCPTILAELYMAKQDYQLIFHLGEGSRYDDSPFPEFQRSTLKSIFGVVNCLALPFVLYGIFYIETSQIKRIMICISALIHFAPILVKHL